jgi:flagellar basal-body rod protein FlgF
MDSLLISAASGMKARMESLDMLANNVANSGTAGFKLDREFYSLYASPEALDATADPGRPSASTLPVIERQWTDFSQGTLTTTGNALNLALSGRGFFIADSPTGPLFTRNGDFRMSKTGQLETPDGNSIRVKTPDGKPLHLDPQKSFDIGTDGTIRQDSIDLGKIEIADLDKADGVSKRGSSYFQILDTNYIPAAAKQADVIQGSLEAANVPIAESAVRLVSVLRQFEMLQRAVSIGTEMDRKSIDEVARV